MLINVSATIDNNVEEIHGSDNHNNNNYSSTLELLQRELEEKLLQMGNSIKTIIFKEIQVYEVDGV